MDGQDIRECGDCGEEYDAFANPQGHDCDQSQPVEKE